MVTNDFITLRSEIGAKGEGGEEREIEKGRREEGSKLVFLDGEKKQAFNEFEVPSWSSFVNETFLR